MKQRLALPVALAALLACLLWSTPTAHAQQLGGSRTAAFLRVNPSARIAALGGTAIAIVDSDLNLATYAPSLANATLNNQLALTYVVYPAGISYGNIAFAKTLHRQTYVAALQYLNYGSMERTDPTGATNGTFYGGEYLLQAGTSRQLARRITGGAALKFHYGTLAEYRTTSIAADVSATYQDTAHLFATTLLLRNVGTPLKPYFEGDKATLPLDVQLGFSKRLEHVPFRFSLVLHSLQQFNIRYNDTADRTYTPQSLIPDSTAKTRAYTGDKILRHVVFGGEILLSKNFIVRLGYNHLLRREMVLPNRPGLAGFSFGATIRINRFGLTYGHAAYHLAGSTNAFTITTDLDRFRRK